MLQITRQTEYAIRGLQELARREVESPVQLKVIASACEVSEAFLAKIFQMLAQDPRQISLRQVVEICEGGIVLNHCLRKVDPCKDADTCTVARVWREAQDALTGALDRTSLADVI